MAELKLVADEGQMLIDEKRPLHALITDLEVIKAEYAAASKIAKDLEDAKKSLENLIIARLEEEQLHDASNGRYRASVQEEEVPSVEDWEQTYNYIAENKYFHLLYRQLNAGAYRELLAAGETLPGAAPFTKKKLSFTKVSKK